MISIYSLSALVAAYLFGSIPTAVWIGQAFYGIDVREYGSGNAGATNTFRVLGKSAGIAVMTLDIFKGWTATNLAYLIGLSVTGPQHSVQFVNYQLALGIIAVMGHLFPIFAGFRGGKGIATLFGMILAVHAQAALLQKQSL
jgi:glycerol-3-phosphate acyltransferase PlsY